MTKDLAEMPGGVRADRKGSVAVLARRGRTAPRSHPDNRLHKPEFEALTVLVVDDHDLIREGLSLLLRDTEVCGDVLTASNGADALELIKTKDIDVVLLDLFLRGESGLDVVARIRQLDRDLPVIVLSASESPRDIREAFQRGANGYLVKSMSTSALIGAIKLVMIGQRIAPLPLSFIGGQGGRAGDERAASTMFARPDIGGERHARLTVREATVLSLIKKGMSNKEVGRALGILEATVKVHLKSIFRKLGAKNRTMAALMATAEDEPPDQG